MGSEVWRLRESMVSLGRHASVRCRDGIGLGCGSGLGEGAGRSGVGAGGARWCRLDIVLLLRDQGPWSAAMVPASGNRSPRGLPCRDNGRSGLQACGTAPSEGLPTRVRLISSRQCVDKVNGWHFRLHGTHTARSWYSTGGCVVGWLCGTWSAAPDPPAGRPAFRRVP
ncbi:hypothetical protein FMEAI12_3940033 [Parafrankia sp. Ea1.12]|nr:hypothetical protein FMEAI12_3940033 [Parafrankia sp. Ea1.12]